MNPNFIFLLNEGVYKSYSFADKHAGILKFKISQLSSQVQRSLYFKQATHHESTQTQIKDGCNYAALSIRSSFYITYYELKKSKVCVHLWKTISFSPSFNIYEHRDKMVETALIPVRTGFF